MLDLWTQTTEWFLMELKIKVEKQTLVLLSALMIKQRTEIEKILFIFEISIKSPLCKITTK